MEKRTSFANIKEFNKYISSVISSIEFMNSPRFSNLRENISNDEATQLLAKRVQNYNTAKNDVFSLLPSFNLFLTKYSPKKVGTKTVGRIVYIYLGIFCLFGIITAPISFFLFKKAKELKDIAETNKSSNVILEQQLQEDLAKDGNDSFSALINLLCDKSNGLEYFSTDWYYGIPEIVNEINSGRSSSIFEAKQNIKKDEERQEELRLRQKEVEATEKLTKAINKLNK